MGSHITNHWWIFTNLFCPQECLDKYYQGSDPCYCRCSTYYVCSGSRMLNTYDDDDLMTENVFKNLKSGQSLKPIAVYETREAHSFDLECWIFSGPRRKPATEQWITNQMEAASNWRPGPRNGSAHSETRRSQIQNFTRTLQKYVAFRHNSALAPFFWISATYSVLINRWRG